MKTPATKKEEGPRCGAVHPKKPKEVCVRDAGHVGTHMNNGNIMWKEPKQPAPAEPEVTEPQKAEAVEDRVYAMIVAEPGRTAPQIGRRYSKAIAALESAGRIEWRDEGWHPVAAAPEAKPIDKVFGTTPGETPPKSKARKVHQDEPEQTKPQPQADENTTPAIKVHPAADKLPMIGEAEFAEFVEDIKMNGLRKKPVLDYTGEWLVDGRNRDKARKILGLPLEYDRLPEDTDIEAYVISENLKGRRHLDPDQRAMLAIEIANLSRGRPSKNRPEGGISLAKAGEVAGLSERRMQRASTVRSRAVPELVEAVTQGKVDLKGAEQVSKLSPAKQRELVKERIEPAKGKVRAGKLAALTRQEEKREVVRNINTGKVRPMPAGQYGVIYGDYPWLFENSDQHEGSRGHMPYPGMPMPEIYAHAREAAKRAGKDCVVALWFVNAFLHEIGAVLGAYGATQRTAWTWDKTTKNDKDKKGVGSWGRPRTEHLVIASIGNPVHTLNEVDTLIRAAVREPGRKPEVFAELLQKHCAGPFLELFGREQREGWEVWGAETTKFDGRAA